MMFPNSWNGRLRRRAVCAAVAGTLLSVGCKKQQNEAPRVASAATSDPMAVTITPGVAANLQYGHAELHDVTGSLQVAARIETDVTRVARVGSPVSGRILRLYAFEGQRVRGGMVLASLHSTDLSDAQLQLIKAQSQQTLAEASVKRAEQLVAADVIGKAELERRRAEQLQASAEAASYRTQLRGLGMSEGQIAHLESVHKLSADYPIVAPRAGTVLDRKITIGQVVEPADEAFTIADLSNVWVAANVPEQEAGTLHRGMEVVVRLPAMPHAEIHGNLSYVAPVVDPATRTVEVRMTLPNPEGSYKPDELATMTLTGRSSRKLTVPSTAVVRENNKDYVFVSKTPNTFAMREVQFGDEVDDRRVVLSGLGEDERIVTVGAFHLNNQRKQNAIKGGE